MWDGRCGVWDAKAKGTGAAVRRLRSLRDLGKEACALLTGGGVCPFGAALAPGYFLSRLRREDVIPGSIEW